MKLMAFLISLVLTCVVQFPANAQECAADTTYQQALDAYNDEQYDVSQDLLDCLIETEPNIGINYNLRGLTFMKQEEYQLARLDFEKVVEIDDLACPCGLSNLGFLYELIGDFEKALDYHQQALAKATNARDTYYIRIASAYINLSQPEKALEQYELALKEDARFFGIYLARGNYWANLGETRSAAEDFMKYVEANSTNNSRGLLKFNRINYTLWFQGKTEYWAFEGQRGQTFVAYGEARADDLEVDPLLVLLLPDGTPWWASDDVAVNADEPTTLASRIDVGLPETGTYTLVVTHAAYYSDNTGSIGLISWLIDEDDALAIGNEAIITAGTTPLNVRAKPTLDGDIIDVVGTGTVVKITDGPRYGDGYRWWQIEDENGNVGWSAEFVDEVRQITKTDQ